MVRRRRGHLIVRPDTALISRGFDPKLSVGSARPAVFRSSTYVFSSPESAERAFDIALGRSVPAHGESVDLIYARLSHPNAEILEDHLTAIEPKAEAAAVFNTGMAAISTIFLALLRPGSAFVHTTPVYGGTQHLIHQLLEPMGIRAVPVPAGDSDALAEAIATTPKLGLVFIETPANPTLVMTDIAHAAKAAAALDPRPPVVVDNTFLGPTFQQALDLGADLSVYSATKYLAGQSDMLGGAVLSSQPALISMLRGLRAVLGNILPPDEAWILDSRLPTVALRMHVQERNAHKVATALAEHPAVARVIHPAFFADAAQAELAARQCTGHGGMVALDLHGGRRAAFDFLRTLTITRNAVSLGGIESLACHPRTTTHAELSEEELERYGIGEGLVRLSIGIEDPRDLIEDFERGLDAAMGPAG